jgi:hypothetical protein
MYILHQPQNRYTLPWAEIALFLLELGNDLTIRSNHFPFKKPVGFPRRLEDVANPVGHVAIQDAPLIGGWEAVGNR